ncbi:MAG: type I glutamate--ammonia ligase [Spirochaetota bacterium]
MAEVTYASIQERINLHKIEYIDLKTIDLVGRLHHITIPVEQFRENILTEGIGFDGSSYGFLKVENSDMVQRPDLSTHMMDPFRKRPTMSFFVTVHLTDDERTRYPHDVRYIGEKAEQCLRNLEIADDAYWGPEYEFHIFGDAEYINEKTRVAYEIYPEEEMFQNNAYHCANPQDLYADFRDEACSYLEKAGIKVKYHHHEVGREGQQEIELMFTPLLKTADQAVITKYILFNLAKEWGLKITFMPKPIYKAAGNGWHLHQYLIKNNKNIFYKENEYANLSETARHYIGGVLKHAKSLSALANPSTNSYKRLVRGFEAPVSITFGQANRTSAIRIPKYIADPEKTRMEYRPGDATANPYIYISAMLMAGIDGIVNKYDPEELGYGPYDKKNVEAGDNIDYLPRSLGEALKNLEEDHDYLLRENVFDKKFIENWINKKQEEIDSIVNRPHPFEYEMYFEL